MYHWQESIEHMPSDRNTSKNDLLKTNMDPGALNGAGRNTIPGLKQEESNTVLVSEILSMLMIEFCKSTGGEDRCSKHADQNDCDGFIGDKLRDRNVK